MEARFCERCGALTNSPQVVEGHYYCSRCVAKLTAGASGSTARTDSAPSPSSASLRDSAAPVEDRLKFRCSECGTLLSSKRVSQKSRLRCPRCHTELFLNPDGRVEPAVKVRQPSTPAVRKRTLRSQTGFSPEELQQALDMQKGPRGEPDEMSERMPVVAPPPPPPKPVPKMAAAPPKPVPEKRISRSTDRKGYRKMAAVLERGEGEGLVVFVAVLLLLPAVFILLVSLNVGGLGRVKDSFKGMAQSVGEAALRLRGLAPKQKQPKKQPVEEGGSVKKQLKQPPEEEKPHLAIPKKALPKQQPKKPLPQKPKGAEKGG